MYVATRELLRQANFIFAVITFLECYVDPMKKGQPTGAFSGRFSILGMKWRPQWTVSFRNKIVEIIMNGRSLGLLKI